MSMSENDSKYGKVAEPERLPPVDVTTNETKPTTTREAIINAARAVFIEQGYAVNISLIAEMAKVSRTTLYNQFGSKEGLLRAMLDASGNRLMDSIAEHENYDLRDTLLDYAWKFERSGCSPTGILFYRFVVSDLSNFPDLATAAYNAGMGRMAKSLSVYLQKMIDQGELEPWFDPDLTAERFFGAVVALMRHRALSTLGLDPPEKRAAQIRETVETFVRALEKR